MSCEGGFQAYIVNVPSARRVLVFVLMRSNSLVILEVSHSLLDSLLSADCHEIVILLSGHSASNH